ncbi:glycosyltransferase N-terminal domain-containing protein [Sulfitobacter sp. LCG007]
MARYLGLAAYRAWSQRGDPSAYLCAQPRPSGELVWIHAADPSNLSAINDLALRLAVARYGLNVLVTLPKDAAPADSGDLAASRILMADTPKSDHPAAVRGFVEHWAPTVGLWSWGRLRPNLIQCALDSGCEMALIDADADGFDGRRDRWIPEVTRQILARFKAIMVRSGGARARLENLGVPPARIERLAPLQAGGRALPCNARDEAELSAALYGRQVWLATGVQPGEVATVLAAHRAAMRLSHRLLLILLLAEPDTDGKIAERIRADGMHLERWCETREPGELTQVLLADDEQDLGLFYRVAPVAFLGSSLSPDYSGRDPFEAAALGSAVLYGPNIRRYLQLYTRLANAGAARIVNDAHALGIAVSRLMAADQAASMAHAGWDVISQGAAVTDRVIDHVQATLDTIDTIERPS